MPLQVKKLNLTPLLTEINCASLAERAYTQLEAKLVTLQLKPGALISEGELIEMTGIGRTPVREAIQRLAQQELFRVVPRKGLLVAPVSRSGMLNILETRKPLERLVVHRAALNARDEQRSGLSAIARELAACHERFDEFLRLDHELDVLLDDCAANPFAATALLPLRSHSRRFWFYHRARIQLSDAIAAHAQLARLVARRDFNGAQKASDGIIAVLERLAGNADRMSRDE
ncbi:MAG TPA: GntR family transcriptional regulator [Xanthomonadales bacterium]|nr:GntR family transcriptional regulator [Xanthomonadales bacterium]